MIGRERERMKRSIEDARESKYRQNVGRKREMDKREKKQQT